ncbi:hypothetical protein HF998_01285 [Cellulomonas hominis]|nr:hypothetical protein [Cellulomonas hominis]MBB5474837.1 hypothetical protein [Cellulomonas hominis]NKY05637.1 hypothetical protein [Cellulomonas hominis]
MASITCPRPGLPVPPDGTPLPTRVKLLLTPIAPVRAPQRAADGAWLYAPFVLKVEFGVAVVQFDLDEGAFYACIDPQAPAGMTDEQVEAACSWSLQVWSSVYHELLLGGRDHLRLWAQAAGIGVWESTD